MLLHWFIQMEKEQVLKINLQNIALKFSSLSEMEGKRVLSYIHPNSQGGIDWKINGYCLKDHLGNAHHIQVRADVARRAVLAPHQRADRTGWLPTPARGWAAGRVTTSCITRPSTPSTAPQPALQQVGAGTEGIRLPCSSRASSSPCAGCTPSATISPLSCRSAAGCQPLSSASL